MLIRAKNIDYELTIGLEVHAQMNTRLKLFSNAPVLPLADANTCVDIFDIALPGSLPVLNWQCVELAVKTGLALKANINKNSKFDRKHYFYPDLPSGYQITQFFEPIVTDGHLDIELEDGTLKSIRIKQIHIEQDAGKLLHDQDSKNTFIDFNRAGVPLMEIVSEPDIRSIYEAVEYVKNLQAILRDINTSDADMDKGNFRCDVNISIRPRGAKEYGVRTEIKNLNSFDSIRRAIEYEVKRRVEFIEQGREIDQETRLFDPDKNETRVLRSKEDAIDYRYFQDPDLRPIVLTDDLISSIKATIKPLPLDRKKKYISEYKLNHEDAVLIAFDRVNSEYYEQIVRGGVDPKIACNWMIVELFGRLNKAGKTLQDSPVDPKNMVDLLNLIQTDVISGKIAKDVLDLMFETGRGANEIVEQKGLKQITDKNEIYAVIDQIIAQNPKQVEEYKSGKEKMFGFFVGQAMKLTGGKANPQLINDILKNRLS